MAKKRTRKQKIKTGFKVAFGSIKGAKNKKGPIKEKVSEAKYFRSDLTKVIVLTMLALALEIALWLYLMR